MKRYSIFIDDMGSFSTNAKNLEDLTWHVNSVRDHDGLKHVSEGIVKKNILAIGLPIYSHQIAQV